MVKLPSPQDPAKYQWHFGVVGPNVGSRDQMERFTVTRHSEIYLPGRNSHFFAAKKMTGETNFGISGFSRDVFIFRWRLLLVSGRKTLLEAEHWWVGISDRFFFLGMVYCQGQKMLVSGSVGSGSWRLVKYMEIWWNIIHIFRCDERYI